MQLTEAQANQARDWLKDGLKLSDFQKRVEKEFGLRLTYMDTRLLVDDLRVVPKDIEPPKAPVAPMPPATTTTTQAFTPDTLPAQGGFSPTAAPTPDAAVPPATGGVSVTTDAITRPGALASGSVTFSDGQKAQWYLDQTGRFGMVPAQRGYRPSQPDVQEFQTLLDRELQKLGY